MLQKRSSERCAMHRDCSWIVCFRRNATRSLLHHKINNARLPCLNNTITGQLIILFSQYLLLMVVTRYHADNKRRTLACECNLTFPLPNNNICSYQLVKTMQFTAFYIEIKFILCIIKFSLLARKPTLQYFLLLIWSLGKKIIVQQSQTKLLFILNNCCAQLKKLTSSFD